MRKNTMPIARACGRALAPRRHVRSLVVLAAAAVVLGVVGSTAAVAKRAAGPTVTVVILANPWVSPENGATRSRFGVLPSPPGSQKKEIQLNRPPAKATASVRAS